MSTTSRFTQGKNPHPPALAAPCPSLVPCGCPPDTGTALCPDSPTAAHQWVDGEWCRPTQANGAEAL